MAEKSAEEKAKFKKILITTLILLIGVSLIPLIYSATYIASVWDVYGNTDKLPIAVVNLDEGATYDGKQVNFGDDVTDALKDNTQMKWTFVSAEQAKRGLEETNEYYAVITIPEDFSADLTSAASTTKTQATIQYSSNEKRNYTASLMLRSAMTSLKDKVKSKEANKITDTLVAELNGVPDKLETAADGAKQLEDGAIQLNNGYSQLLSGNQTITENLYTLSTGIDSAKDGTNRLYIGAEKIPELIEGAKQLSDGADTLSASAPKITNGIKSVSDGLDTLQEGVSSGIVSGKQSLSEQLEPAITSGVNTAIDQTVSTLTPAVASGIQTTVNTLNPSIIAGVQQAVDNINPAIDSAIETTVDTLNPAIDSAVTQTSDTLNTAVEGAVSGALNNALGSDSQAQTGINNYVESVDALIAYVESGDINTAQYIASQIKQSGAGQSVKAIPANVSQGLNAGLVSGLEGGISTGLTDSLAPALKSGISNGLTGQLAPQLKAGIESGLSDTSNPSSLSSQLTAGVSEGLSNQLAPQLIAGINNGLTNELAPQLSKGLSDGVSAKVNDGLDTIDASVTGGIAQLQTGILGTNNSGKLADGSTALLSGSSQLSAGTAALAEGSSTLADGSAKLTALQDGLDELNSGMNQLSDGSVQLAAGSETLGSGLASASDGNNQLLEGITTLSNGLSTSIVQSRDRLKITDGLAEHVENDVDVVAYPYEHVENYGESFAPYFFNVSLWTGGLISMITLYYDYKRRLTWLGPSSPKPFVRFFTFLAMGVAQGILCGIVAQFALGIGVNNPVLYYFGLASIGAVYTLIIECLMLNFGDIGKMLSMIMMVLQLTATGGTFPVELNPPFFGAISKFLPMTYGIQAMKEAISGSNIAYGMRNLGMLLAFGAIALGGILLGKLIKYHASKEVAQKEGNLKLKVKNEHAY